MRAIAILDASLGTLEVYDLPEHVKLPTHIELYIERTLGKESDSDLQWQVIDSMYINLKQINHEQN